MPASSYLKCLFEKLLWQEAQVQRNKSVLDQTSKESEKLTGSVISIPSSAVCFLDYFCNPNVWLLLILLMRNLSISARERFPLLSVVSGSCHWLHLSFGSGSAQLKGFVLSTPSPYAVFLSSLNFVDKEGLSSSISWYLYLPTVSATNE